MLVEKTEERWGKPIAVGGEEGVVDCEDFEDLRTHASEIRQN